MTEPRRLPDHLSADVNDTVLIMRTAIATTATAVERTIKSSFPDALVEIVHQPTGMWLVASARGAGPDALWRQAQEAVPAGESIERRTATGWQEQATT